MSEIEPYRERPTEKISLRSRVLPPRRRLLVLVGGAGAILLVLIVGIIVLLSHRGGNHAAAGVAQTFAAPRAGNTGKLDLTANAATVAMHPLDTGNANLLQGAFTPGKDRGDAILAHKGDTWKLAEENGSADAADSAMWDIGIASDIAFDLSMTLDATSSDVDLKAITLSSLDAEANASTLRLILPASYSGDTKGKIKAAAGNVQVTVPPGAAVRIVIETRAGSRDVPTRFVQKNGGYDTPEYAGAKNRLTLTISANAGRVTIV